MSKKLISIFNFISAKKFLEIMEAQIHDSTLEGNVFTHSNNPLLNMCLLYELFLLLIKKFFSLNNQCRVLMKVVMDMMLTYIDAVDDENFLTTVMLEKDYSGRDVLRIAVELELLELIQAPKVEGTIKRIYNSDFDQSGDIMEMSTSYQIMFGSRTVVKDPESEFRFYKKRIIDNVPQSQWMFEIFKDSMNCKILAQGIISLIFVCFSTYYYEIVIEEYVEISAQMVRINVLRKELMFTNDLHLIAEELKEAEEIYHEAEKWVGLLLGAFNIVVVICYMNITFLLQHITTFIFTFKMNRFYVFPTILHVTDTVFAMSSIYIIQWVKSNIFPDLAEGKVPIEETYQRLFDNMRLTIGFKF